MASKPVTVENNKTESFLPFALSIILRKQSITKDRGDVVAAATCGRVTEVRHSPTGTFSNYIRYQLVSVSAI
jgi:hypothetical protein